MKYFQLRSTALQIGMLGVLVLAGYLTLTVSTSATGSSSNANRGTANFAVNPFVGVADVTAPGDPIVGVAAVSGSNTSSLATVGGTIGTNTYPAGESPANAINNNVSSKYLNFTATNVGFIVTPVSQGPLTVVDGIHFSTASDVPGRDPLTVTIEGTTDPNPTTTLNSNWTLIYSGPSGLAADPGRLASGPSVSFANSLAFRSYRVLVMGVRNAATEPTMQIGEVELLGATPSCIENIYGISIGYDTIANNTIYRINPATGATSNVHAVTLPGFTVYNSQALVARPSDGVLFAIVQTVPLGGGNGGGSGNGSANARRLVTIDPSTGVATDVGLLGVNFANLAFRSNGVLYGVTGEGGANPESLFTINTTTAARTFVMALGNGNDGETIAFHPNGLLYHSSGNSTALFESVNVDTFVVTPIGSASGEMFAMGYSPADGQFYGSSIGDDLFTLNIATGARTFVGQIPTVGTNRGIAVAGCGPSISINNVTHNEGNAGTTYTFSVSLNNPPTAGAPVTVNYSTVDGSAQDDNPATEDNDYQAKSGTLTFTSTGPTVQTVTVLVNGDSKFEANETFTLHLSNPVNATIASGDGVGTLLNDDFPPNFTVSNATASEGNTGLTPFTFTITKSGNPTVLASTLTYSTTSGTATAPDDYVPIVGGTVTFAPGETTKTVVVSVVGDPNVEPTETFTLNLQSATNGVVVDGSGTGTIANDDGGLGGLEGDIVDANGGPAGGDGVTAGDVTVISQKVLNPTTTPPFTVSQFQRADVNAPCGNGGIDSGDVTVISQFALGLIAPVPACGPTTPVGSPDRPEDSEGTARVIRAVNTTAVAGGTVTVSFVLVSQGNEASASYSVTFPQGTLTNPQVAAGSGVPSGTTVLTNSEAAQGRIGVLIATPNSYTAGTRQMITITFNVSAQAAPGTYPIGFSSTPVGQNVSAAAGGALLPTTYEPGNVVIGATAAGVEVSGRITTPDGRGLRNAMVTITDSKGNQRTATTGSFGNYRFVDVEAGESYVIAVTSKRYRFASRVVNVADTLTDVDFVAQE